MDLDKAETYSPSDSAISSTTEFDRVRSSWLPADQSKTVAVVSLLVIVLALWHFGGKKK